MAKKITYTEEDLIILKQIEDNIIFKTFKEKLLTITKSLTDDEFTIENIEDKYLWSFDNIADKLRNEQDVLNDTEADIFDQFLDIFHENTDQYEFKILVQIDLKSLSEKILNEWKVALKAIRSTYKPEKN